MISLMKTSSCACCLYEVEPDSVPWLRVWEVSKTSLKGILPGRLLGSELPWTKVGISSPIHIIYICSRWYILSPVHLDCLACKHTKPKLDMGISSLANIWYIWMKYSLHADQLVCNHPIKSWQMEIIKNYGKGGLHISKALFYCRLFATFSHNHSQNNSNHPFKTLSGD